MKKWRNTEKLYSGCKTILQSIYAKILPLQIYHGYPRFPLGIPQGFDVINLPVCKYLMFQGEPFPEEDYCQAIEQMWEAIKKYDPTVIGYTWDKENPRIQLEPIGTRGYIELVAIK